MSRTRSFTSFNNAAISDRELLALVLDALGADGQATTSEVADRVALQADRPLISVGTRLAYLRRVGMLERDPNTRGWFLTPAGESLVAGRLTAAARRALADLDGGAAWAATEALAALLRDARSDQATMMRRQWQHGWLQRNGR